MHSFKAVQGCALQCTVWNARRDPCYRNATQTTNSELNMLPVACTSPSHVIQSSNDHATTTLAVLLLCQGGLAMHTCVDIR